ncbi:MAG: hypothetical protein ACI9Y1_001567 [Lentisphaeria bacterium]
MFTFKSIVIALIVAACLAAHNSSALRQNAPQEPSFSKALTAANSISSASLESAIDNTPLDQAAHGAIILAFAALLVFKKNRQEKGQ